MTAKITNNFTFTDNMDLQGYVLYPFGDKKPVFHRDWYQNNVLLWRKMPTNHIDLKKFLGDRLR